MIDVLMATYRPRADWLQAQVESIRAQAGVEVNLIRREDAAGRGPCANFAALLAESTAPYVAFADQDDVWLPNKLATCLARLKELERKYGPETPLLVFTDSKVVDAELKVISGSFLCHRKLDPRRLKPTQLAFQNVVSGNALLMNAALRKLALPIPEEALMHDFWLALVASTFGHIAFIDESTLLYRQHGNNVLGGAGFGLTYLWRHLCEGRAAAQARLSGHLRQVEAFVARYGADAPQAFHQLVGLRAKIWPKRVLTLIRGGFFKAGLLRNLITWTLI